MNNKDADSSNSPPRMNNVKGSNSMNEVESDDFDDEDTGS
jgi:hypothetical protein